MAPLLVNCAAIELISPAIHIGKWLNSLVRKVTVIQLLLIKKLEPDTGAFDWIEHDVRFLVVRALSLTDQALVLTDHEVGGPLPARPGVDPVGPALTAWEPDLTRHAVRGVLAGVALILTWKKKKRTILNTTFYRRSTHSQRS